jgi:hypothetical protein
VLVHDDAVREGRGRRRQLSHVARMNQRSRQNNERQTPKWTLSASHHRLRPAGILILARAREPRPRPDSLVGTALQFWHHRAIKYPCTRGSTPKTAIPNPLDHMTFALRHTLAPESATTPDSRWSFVVTMPSLTASPLS